MYFENDNNLNSNDSHKNTTETTESCTSSTDSGIIIIDNTATFNTHQNDSASETTRDKANVEIHNNTKTSDGKLNFSNSKGVNASFKSDKKNINIENTISIENKSKETCNAEIYTDISNDRQSPRMQNGFIKPSIQKYSPTVSIRSTTISIVSIDENAIDSSIVDSDSDFEADAEGVHSNYTVKKLGQQTTYGPNSPNLPNLNKGLTVVSQKINPGGSATPGVGTLTENILSAGSLCPPGAPLAPNTPQIGSIALSNSTDVTFGDKHFYEGPVTIQQFLIDSRDKWKANGEDGEDNPTFTCDRGAKGNANDKEANNPPSQPQQPYKFIFNRKAVIITATIILLTILIGILIVTTNAIMKNSTQKNLTDDSYIFNGSLIVVTREEWHARSPPKELNKQNLPAHRVIIAHTASEPCETKSICDYRVQVIQNFHMDSQQWDDIGYNFLVSSDGLVYEGRGWDYVGAHTKGYNTDSVCISFIGTFTKLKPTEKQLQAAQLIIEEGVNLKKLDKDYRLYGARQMSGTESPGDALFNIIRKWPHWSRQI